MIDTTLALQLAALPLLGGVIGFALGRGLPTYYRRKAESIADKARAACERRDKTIRELRGQVDAYRDKRARTLRLCGEAGKKGAPVTNAIRAAKREAAKAMTMDALSALNGMPGRAELVADVIPARKARQQQSSGAAAP